jgi:nicotinamidase/pyrazinamidase
MKTLEAFIQVDPDKCFMPKEEGERLGSPEGFGELPVPGGEKIVKPLNEMTEAATQYNLPIEVVQEWHDPKDTVHFSDNPNFINTWPRHGIANTPGAELHPELLVAINPDIATRYMKGDVPAESPEKDLSYTGKFARNLATDEMLPDALRRKGITKLYIGGLAIGDGTENKLCVDHTATDLFKDGFEVTVLTDAVEAIFPENRVKCFKALGELGVKLLTTNEAIEELNAKYGE